MQSSTVLATIQASIRASSIMIYNIMVSIIDSSLATLGRVTKQNACNMPSFKHRLVIVHARQRPRTRLLQCAAGLRSSASAADMPLTAAGTAETLTLEALQTPAPKPAAGAADAHCTPAAGAADAHGTPAAGAADAHAMPAAGAADAPDHARRRRR